MTTEEEIEQSASKLNQLAAELNSVIFGQEDLIRLLILGIVSRGHVLLEGLPGLGKTELIKALAKAIELKVARVQFTPDLLPGDITGSPILQETNEGRKFVFQAGPVFTNLLLADEINRASPKTQSALLEAMQENKVTAFGNTYVLPKPFFVLATQNPIELEGTYTLPEAQLDRFLFKVNVTHNSPDILEKIVKVRDLGIEPKVNKVLVIDELIKISETVRKIYLPEVVINYIARLVDATHNKQYPAAEYIKYGASPRAAIALSIGARSAALFAGRVNASFEDVKDIATSVLAHRVILNYEGKIKGKSSISVVRELLEQVPFNPRKASPLLKENHA